MDASPSDFLGLVETVERVAEGQISPVAVSGAILARIDRLQPSLNAYLCVNPKAPAAAEKLRRKLEQGDRTSPLAGACLSLKDIILTRDMPTTAGSRVLGKGLSGSDALLVGRLRRAGALLVGKNNLHEFAFGVTNDNAHYGPARNPWDRDRISGGSSGGSAVAVAAGLCSGSIGTDTRGSIRIPSACCGITGLKPTLGLVPTRGVIPLSWSLDHVGPMTRSVSDAARLLQVLAGKRRNIVQAPERPLNSFRLGVCEYYFRDLEPEVEGKVREALQVFRDEGLQIREVRIRFLEEALQASDVISRAEAVSYHDRCLREQPCNYGAAVRERLETGYHVSGKEYVEARRIRFHMTREFQRLFRELDCLVAAVLPALPPPVGQDFVDINGRRQPIVHSFVRLNAPQNVGGVPALALPAGFSRSNLPVGYQLIGGHHREAVLFRLGAHYQTVTDWHRRRPPVG